MCRRVLRTRQDGDEHQDPKDNGVENGHAVKAKLGVDDGREGEPDQFANHAEALGIGAGACPLSKALEKLGEERLIVDEHDRSGGFE